MTEVVVFGHSFVAHLQRYMAKDPVRQNLGLYCPILRVRLNGASVFSLKQTNRLAQNEEFVREAGILILEIGTNDLADINKDPRAFAKEVFRFSSVISASLCNGNVQVGKDQEKAQSERDSHSKNRGGKKQTNNQALIP